jgi:hypothetical protein
MKRFKLLQTSGLGLFVLIDLIAAFRLWSSGWPKEIALTSVVPGVVQISVMEIPFTQQDWLILAAAGVFHLVLVVMVWRAWKSG